MHGVILIVQYLKMIQHSSRPIISLIYFPQWFLRYGDKTYFDPGNPKAQHYLVMVIKDLVQRYDVDAIHFDDFYHKLARAHGRFGERHWQKPVASFGDERNVPWDA